ncbi:translation initiation factor IF-2 [Dehalobacter sp. DCM]|uniref:translation initiation factor IF-2 n=1 Tax=Dehalobacter sp. DCM TaxID=2907827 RepID=UPI0030816106|nr:translation initiation factor IF-2 [Dehalobacter sp. DCM]
MSNIRVHELAKELNISSKDLIEKLNVIGVPVKNHMSAISMEEAESLKKTYKKSSGSQDMKDKEPAAPIAAADRDIQGNRPPVKDSGTQDEGHMRRRPPEDGQRMQGQRPPGERPAGDRPMGQRPSGDRPQGDRPMSQRPMGDRPYGDRPPHGQRPQGDRPMGQRPQGDRPYGDRPMGQRPMGDRPYSDRPQGQRPQGDRPMGQRPQGDRPYGDRPMGQRPPGDRPMGQRPMGDRPYGDRPQGQRPQGDRPMGQRPQGDRPYGDRPMGQRPMGDRPYGDRPQGQRPPGDRPMGQRPQGDRPYGDRPQGQRPYGDRPQGQRPYGDRPQGQRPFGDRPQGQRPPMGGDRPFTPRPQGDFRPSQRPAGDDRRQQGGRPPFGDTSRRPGQGQRPGSDKKAPQMQRIKIEGKSVELTVSEQPVKRQAPDKKKAHENKQFFDKKRSDEKDLTTILRKNDRTPLKAPKEVVPKHIVIPESLSVQELAMKMSRKASEVIKELMKLGVMATINQEVDSDTATIVATEMGITVEVRAEKSMAVIDEIEDAEADLRFRPPVVTVMGHVDHGKTSLLDAIRSANVTASEAGGITQHIGAYQVEIKGQKITFLDTPGHEAFTAMRARGAQVTDIAVLVVAADDGVMPQTVEAINHAKAANVPIIVAINKVDKENANPDRVKQELTEYGLVVEEWGGETIAVPVSAKARLNIDNLLEMILLVAEMKDLKANPNRQATGTVIEAKLDKGKGPVATVLVSKGTLNIGDIIIAGHSFGRIRAMVDDKGRRVKKAGPSLPVEVQGLSEVPPAGEIFNVVNDEKLARNITDARVDERKAEEIKAKSRISLDDLFEKIKEGEVKDLNIIIKADVQGSVEAIKQSLAKLTTSEVRVNIIHGGVGAISESDVMLAAASNAIIIGFNVRHDSNTKSTAELQGVDIRLYRVIYDAIDDIKAAMEGMLDPDFKEVIQGKAEVRQTFKVPKAGMIAGSYVTEGKIHRADKIRVIRDGIVIHEGELESLRRFKDDAKEVAEGYECGIGIKNFNDIKEGDIVEAFIMEEVKREL